SAPTTIEPGQEDLAGLDARPRGRAQCGSRPASVRRSSGVGGLLGGRSGSLGGLAGGGSSLGGRIGSGLGGVSSSLGGHGGRLGGGGRGLLGGRQGLLLLRAGGERQRHGNGTESEFGLHWMIPRFEWKKRPRNRNAAHCGDRGDPSIRVATT